MKLAVDIKGLVVQFDDFKAVDDITFAVKPGEIFGFLGANGAGKTTTIRVLCGLLVPTDGQVEVAEITMGPETADQIKSKVGYMSQKFTLYNDLSVEENLSFTASLRKLPLAYYRERKKFLFDFISFDQPPSTMVRDLPGGIKQQVSLAASMLHDPEIIFLDEPTAGVSSASRENFWNLIKSLAKRGKTIFVTSHYMDEVEQCDRIALMRSGKLIALDTPTGMKKSTFDRPLYELSPVEKLPFQEVEKIRKEYDFDFLEPYGLRFHASPGNEKEWNSFKNRYSKEFRIKEIVPSLEDVFIRLVEGKNR